MAVAGGNKGLRPGHAYCLPSPEGQAQSRSGFGSGAPGGPAPPSSVLMGRRPTKNDCGPRRFPLSHPDRSTVLESVWNFPCSSNRKKQDSAKTEKESGRTQKTIRDAACIQAANVTRRNREIERAVHLRRSEASLVSDYCSGKLTCQDRESTKEQKRKDSRGDRADEAGVAGIPRPHYPGQDASMNSVPDNKTAGVIPKIKCRLLGQGVSKVVSGSVAIFGHSRQRVRKDSVKSRKKQESFDRLLSPDDQRAHRKMDCMEAMGGKP